MEEEAKPDEDDRQPVEDEELPTEAAPKVEVVEGPPIDTDDLEGKTKSELQELLTKKGIPFGKNDNKNTLITFLKATA